jgi:Second Messenger Oligonucleotide or Dinucleotide Synthetase domain/Adenylyl/Guanylyl and SMODS C-terminal sensor domain
LSLDRREIRVTRTSPHPAGSPQPTQLQRLLSAANFAAESAHFGHIGRTFCHMISAANHFGARGCFFDLENKLMPFTPKIIALFDRFLVDEVNLNKTRIEALTGRVATIEKFIRNSDWRPGVRGFSAQGSWAHKTIIKPPGSLGFDADLLAYVSPVPGWTAKDYVVDLRRVFVGSNLYKDKLTLSNRCVTLEYSGDFSLDIVPCVVDRMFTAQCFEVCNRADDRFELTNSEAFTAWLEQRNAWAGDNHLRNVIRLLKYLRDVKTTFSCKSVLLATLLGSVVTPADAQSFPDLPSALRMLIGRLDAYLQARTALHKVVNPVLPAEDFVRHWDADKYANFREMIHKYRLWIDEACEAPTEADSIGKWRRVFGDEFGRGADAESQQTAGNLVPIAVPSLFNDAVEVVQVAGRTVLDAIRPNLPWVKPAPFRIATTNGVGITVRATLHSRREGPALGPMSSGAIINKHAAVHFEALAPNGAPFGRDYEVQWRVVNTDQDAYKARALRGGFYRSDTPSRRWETTLYRGVHWVEAFLLRKRDRICVGQSGRFFVVIQ